MAKDGKINKLDRRKTLLLKAIILVALIILTIVTPTRNAFIGVFGYLFYFYLAFLILMFAIDLIIKGRWKKVPTKKIVLLCLFILFVLITIHITVLGKEVVNSGFSDYIANCYNVPSVGGVILSLISSPIVLPCKYVASTILFFIAAVVTGFICIYPLIFVNKKKEKGDVKKPIKKDDLEEKIENKPNKDDIVKLNNDIVKEIEKENKPEIFEKEETLEDTLASRKEESLRKLFGDNYISKDNTAPKTNRVIVEETKKVEADNDFSLIGGYRAFKVKPNDSLYSDNARIQNFQKRREEASKKLGLHDKELQKKFASIDAFPEKTPETKADEVKNDWKINEYTPSSTIYNDEKNEITEIDEPKITNSYQDDKINNQPNENVINDNKIENEEIEDNSLDLIDNQSFARKSENVVNNSHISKPNQRSNKTYDNNAYDYKKSKKVEKTNSFFAKKEKKKNLDKKENINTIETKPYVYPDKNMLKEHRSPDFVPYVDNVEELKDLIENKLKNYNIDAKYIDAIKGPTVTTCLANLSDTCSISKVMSAKQDINRLLRTTKEINILPQIDGCPYFAIEYPNRIRGLVSFKEIICSKEYLNYKGDLVIAMGKGTDGKILIDDLAEMPHALVAGSTGSGKSVCLNCILASLLFRYSPTELKLVLIDLKKVEMALFAGLPHMLVEKPLYDINEIINTLKWLEKESERRYTAFQNLHVKKLSEYNDKVEKENRLPRIVVIIDEASELMTNPQARKPVEASLSSLARVARAAGIHLIFATQNPVKEVITNEIQNNLNTKIAFQVGDYNHSMVIFKAKGAENLLGKGDMIIRKGGKSMVRAQCAYISGDEIDELVETIKANNDVDFDYDAIDRILHGSKEEIKANTYNNGSVSGMQLEKKAKMKDKWEQTLKDALALCYKHNKASGSLVQRKLNKGSNTTTNIMETLEERGWVSEVVNNKRKFLRTKEEFYEEYPEYDPNNENDGELI